VQQLQPLALPSRSSRYAGDAVAWSVQARDKAKLAGSSPDLASATQYATNSAGGVAAWPIEAGDQPRLDGGLSPREVKSVAGVTDVVRAENKTSSRL